MTVKMEQPLQDGGAPEYAYHDRTAWRCAVFVRKSYGSKGYPQRNAAHVRWTLLVTSSNPLKQHLSGERFPDNDAVEWAVCVWFRQQPQEFYGTGFQGLVQPVGQEFELVSRLHWKINAVCMSLSSLVSFKSRFVTYLLNSPRIWKQINDRYKKLKWYLVDYNSYFLRWGADKNLARPGRKQATATKLQIYSTHSPRS